jgi:hypothetical protein
MEGIIKYENEMFINSRNYMDTDYILEHDSFKNKSQEFLENEQKILSNKFKLILYNLYNEYEDFIFNNIYPKYSYNYNELLNYKNNTYLTYFLEQNGFDININMSGYINMLINNYIYDIIKLLCNNINYLMVIKSELYNEIFSNINYLLLDYLKFRHNEKYKKYRNT